MVRLPLNSVYPNFLKLHLDRVIEDNISLDLDQQLTEVVLYGTDMEIKHIHQIDIKENDDSIIILDVNRMKTLTEQTIIPLSELLTLIKA